MSIILGAIAGAGEAGEKYFQQEQRTDNEVKLAGVRSDLDLQRTKLIAQNVMDNKDADRLQEADDVKEAKTGIIKKAVDQKYATAKPADPSTWTPEMEAAVQQSKGDYADSLQNDSRVIAQAGQETGYITSKEAATLSQNEENIGNKKDALLYKQLYENQKEEGRNNRSDAHIQLAQDKLTESARQSDNRMALLASKIGGGGGGKDNTTAEMLKFLDSSRKEVTSESAELKERHKVALDGARGKEETATVNKTFQGKFDDLDKKRGQVETDLAFVRSKLGLNPTTSNPGTGSPPPATAAKVTRPPLSSFNK